MFHTKKKEKEINLPKFSFVFINMKVSDWIQIYFGTEKGLCYDVKNNLTMLFLVILNFCRTDIADAKTIFLQPQELAIHLRPGVSQSFPLSISMPSDHPTTDLTLDTSNVPAGLNITFSSITTGNPLLMQVRKRNPVQHSLLQKENVPSCLSPKIKLFEQQFLWRCR